MSGMALFEGVGKSVSRKKGDVLFKQGSLDTSIYVVQRGLLKAYYATLDGKELVKSIIAEGEFIGSLISCRLGEPCTFNLVCLEDCQLVRVPFSELQRKSSDKPELAGVVISGLLDLAIKKERREYEFLCLSAPERYQLFIERHPDLVGRLTQNDIARYLGITPVALSRIKQKKTKRCLNEAK